MVPKMIHYIWLGGDFSPELKKYMQTWDVLTTNGYEIKQWNESNLPIDSAPDAIKEAIKVKKYAFAADYFRLKVLYEHGGIYLDTDVEVRKDFEPLLNTGLLLGFIFDASIGTAVIGAEKGNRLVKELMSFYDTAGYEYDDACNSFVLRYEKFPEYRLVNNNDLFTAYFLNYVEGFKLNGKEQHIGDISIYPTDYFEGFTFDKNQDYTVHHCVGSWRSCDEKTNLKSVIRRMLKRVPMLSLIHISRDIKRRKDKNKHLPFSSEYLKQLDKGCK